MSSNGEFARTREVVYLDTAAEGLPPARVGEALTEYYRDKSSGSPGRRNLYRAEAETVAAAARLLGAAPQNVALLSSSSEGLNLLANSLVWRAGDEILIDDLEFSSNVVAWLRLRDQGVHVEVVPSRAGVLSYEQFASRIRPRTKLISVSQVSYKSGTQIPFLTKLSRAIHAVGGILCVDATQAIGRVPVSVEGVDYLVASSYKWLLGIHGLGLVYLSPQLEDNLAPGGAGWYSIRQIFAPDRFERFAYKDGAARLVSGMPNFASIYAMRASLAFLEEKGIERIDRGLRPLVAGLRKGLVEAGLDLLTPEGEEFASGIVSFAHPEAASIGAELEKQGVIVWAGDGRVRASVHLYNDENDIRRYLDVLQDVLARKGVEHAGA